MHAFISNTDHDQLIDLQEERAREIKRRNEAKAIQEAQQMQKDKENQLYLEKIKKERKEAEVHKRRVREQIARDRAERLAERKAEKERQEVAGSSSQQIDNTRYTECFPSPFYLD